MDFIFRPAEKEDTPAIYDLIKEGRINPTGLDWQRFILAVTPEGEAIGCGQIKPHRDGSQELASIAVTSAWQGKGVARAIIERLMDGVDTPLYLMCVSTMGPMYEKFGFRGLEEDEMPKYFRRVSKLAGFIEPLQKEGHTLLVMGRE
jgi:N-acetylglutamate synthase-like GNAT family acetyltransferase